MDATKQKRIKPFGLIRFHTALAIRSSRAKYLDSPRRRQGVGQQQGQQACELERRRARIFSRSLSVKPDGVAFCVSAGSRR